MITSAPVKYEIGKEIDPQIAQIFTDWGRDAGSHQGRDSSQS